MIASAETGEKSAVETNEESVENTADSLEESEETQMTAAKDAGEPAGEPVEAYKTEDNEELKEQSAGSEKTDNSDDMNDLEKPKMKTVAPLDAQTGSVPMSAYAKSMQPTRIVLVNDGEEQDD